MTIAAPPTPTSPPTRLLVASTLAWLVGVLTILISIAAGVPQITIHGRLPFVILAEGLLGVVFCVAGYLLRRGRRAGATVIVIGAIGIVANHLLTRTIFTVGTGLTLVLLVLVWACWKDLR